MNIPEVLDSLGLLENCQVSGLSIKTSCPFHNDPNPSCKISLTTGSFFCFGCEESGNIITLICRLHKCSSFQALRLLKDCKLEAVDRTVFADQIDDSFLLEVADKALWKYKTFPWYSESENTYLYRRGFTRDTVDFFRIKFNKYSPNPIIIPLFEYDFFTGYQSRKIEDGEPKYRFCSDYKKKEWLIGNPNNSSPLLLTEGFLDMMTAWQFGYKNVATILNWSPSDRQIKKISEVNVPVICALDNDDAGEKGFLVLKRNLPVVNRLIFNAKDINSCDEIDFNESIYNCLRSF